MTEAKQKVSADAPEAPPATESGLRVLLLQPIMACLLLAAVTLVVYWPVQSFDFVSLDDPSYVTANPHLRLGLSWQGLLWAFSTRYAAMWHPLTWLSYLADAQVFGAGPAGPHIVNLLLHVANAVVLFLFLRQVTGAHCRSLFVAALFALHPLHVESVAWIAERKDVLSTLFGLLALWAYTAYARHSPAPRFSASTAGLAAAPAPPPAFRRRLLFYLLSLLCFALSLMSKPMFVTLPCLCLLLDVWPLGRLRWEARPQTLQALSPLVVEKLPLFGLAAVASLLTVWAEQGSQALQPLANTPWPLRLENAWVAYVRYLGKTFWPTALALPYPHAAHWPALVVAGAAVLVLGLCAVAAWLGPRRPFVAVGWFWFFGTLIPVIGLVQVGEHSLADRYTYVPLVGFFIVLTWAAAEALAKRRAPALVAALAVLALGACGLRTRDQLDYWQNSRTLFTHSLAVTENNWLAGFALGCHLASTGHTDEAIDAYQYALGVNPRSPEVLNNLGNALVNKERCAEALKCFETALSLKPNRADLHSNYGAALDKAGRTPEAVTEFTRALQLEPEAALSHFRLANSLARLGHAEEAIAHYRLAVHYRPDYTQAINNLAVALFSQGRVDEAIEQFTAALAQMPDDSNTRCNLGNALATRQHWAEAAQQYAEAARLLPQSPAPHYGLARVLLQLGRRDEAANQLKEVLRLNPAHAAAKQQLEALQAPAAR